MKATMTREELKDARKKLGLTGDALGEVLGVTGNTVRRWEMGVRKIQSPVAKLIRRMLEDKEREAVPA